MAAIIWLKYSKTIILWNIITFYNQYIIIIISVYNKAEFWKSHDPSEIIGICWFGAQKNKKTFPIIINVENNHAAVNLNHSC